MLKKVLVAVGVLIGLFVVAAICVPIFVDANKFRPQIEKAVSENINGDLQLGKLSLSLWGGLHVGIDELVLSEKGSEGKKPIFSMKDAKLEIPILSVFSGKPSVTLAVKNPQIFVIKEKNGQINVLNLVKKKADVGAGTAAATSEETGEASSGGGSAPVPFELSFDIEKGYFVYRDLKARTETEIKDFDFELEKFGLNQPFKFSFRSQLDIKQMKDLTLEGPMDFSGSATIAMNASGLEKVDFESELDLTKLKVVFSNLFNKDQSVPLIASVKFSTTMNKFDLEGGQLKFGNASVKMAGTVENFDNPSLNLSINSNDFAFGEWKGVVAPLKDFDMDGSADFKLQMIGSLEKLGFNGQASLKGASLQAPGIVPRVTGLNAQLDFSNNMAKISKATVKIGKSDMAMQGSVKNFKRPVVRLAVNSNLLDVDAMLPKKTEAQKKAEAAEAKKAEAQQQASGKTVSVEKQIAGPIAMMKKNPVMRHLDFEGQMRIKKVIVNKAPLSNVDTQLTFKKLVLGLNRAKVNAFDGKIAFASKINFNGRDPSYSANGSVTKLDVNKAITNQMPSLKDSLMGQMNANFNVKGSGVSKPKVKKTLTGSGKFRLDNGSFSALKPLKMLGEKLKSIPGAKGALGGVKVSEKFKKLNATFKIAGGRFNIVNMIGDLEQARTTLTGQGFVDFDQNMNLAGDVIAPIGGDIPPSLKSSDGRFKIPYLLQCKVKSPCPKWDRTISKIGEAYAKHEGKKILKKEGEKAIKKLFKGFKF